jgi:hypothetical protein
MRIYPTVLVEAIRKRIPFFLSCLIIPKVEPLISSINAFYSFNDFVKCILAYIACIAAPSPKVSSVTTE